VSGRNVPEEFMQYVSGEARRLGYIIVDVIVKSGRDTMIEIEIDKNGGITLDECAEFNRNLTNWIDSTGIFGGNYMIDVESPGLDKVLVTDEHFIWAVGKDIWASTYEPVDGKRELTGRLAEYNKDTNCITVEKKDGKRIEIERKKIARARLAPAI